MGLDDVLIITDRVDDNLRLSSRNLPNVEVLTVGEADPLSLMQFARVLVTRGAVARIEELLAIMNALVEAKKGDAILLDFLPDSGTRVVVNGQPRGKPIAGDDFYRALLRIWLGDKPVDGDLKKGMLGQPG